MPALLDWAMRQERLLDGRRRLVPKAHGRVLEIGVGSGRNLPFYAGEASVVVGLDPSEPLLRMARRQAAAAAVPAFLVEGSASALPLPAASVDAAIMTWTLCSIAEPLQALVELRRVLKPAAELFFLEHGLSPDPRLALWQRRLSPWWRPLAGGCHLDRNPEALLREAGFEILELGHFTIRGPRLLTYMSEGRARPTLSVND